MTPQCDRHGCTRISIATIGNGPLAIRLCAGCEHDLKTQGSLTLKVGTYVLADADVTGLA